MAVTQFNTSGGLLLDGVMVLNTANYFNLVKSGIYTITNLINSKVLVGYTRNLCRRKIDHFKTLKSNNHRNPHLQKAWDKYGEKSFKFEILEECEEQFLASQEHYWATLLNSHDREFGYNLLPTNPNGEINKHCEETRDRMCVAQQKWWDDNKGFQRNWKRRTPQEEKNRLEVYYSRPHKTRKAVIQMDLEGNEIKEYPSISSVIKDGFIKQNVIQVCIGEYKQHKGYLWKYKI